VFYTKKHMINDVDNMPHVHAHHMPPNHPTRPNHWQP
jgi:hypothetical protein